METLTVGCKINLGLKIVGKRPNGYHELDSIFYPLSTPADTLEIEITNFGQSPKITIQSKSQEIDKDNNTLTKCYQLWQKEVATPPSLAINLIKGIPIGAGLGGGSSDAAALLKFLNRTLPSPLDNTALNQLAQKIGADVPFFIDPAPAKITGIGEIITKIQLDLSPYSLILVSPKLKIDTTWAYHAFDAQNLGQEHNPDYLALTKDDFSITYHVSAAHKAKLSLDNDLEQVVLPKYPVLLKIKRELQELGALASAMTGSGSSIFGLFPKDPVRASWIKETLADSCWPARVFNL